MTKAKLELDQDELDDVKGDLIRSGVDRLSRIQRQFNRHEATQKEYERRNPQGGAADNSDAENGSASAIAQFSAWNSLRAREHSCSRRWTKPGKSGKLKQSHEGLQ